MNKRTLIPTPTFHMLWHRGSRSSSPRSSLRIQVRRGGRVAAATGSFPPNRDQRPPPYPARSSAGSRRIRTKSPDPAGTDRPGPPFGRLPPPARVPAYVPKARLTAKEPSPFVPYIFSEDGSEPGGGDEPSGPTPSSPEALCLRAIFRVLYGCGPRIGEVVALRLGEVDLLTGILVVREGSTARIASFRWRFPLPVPTALS